MTFLQAEMLLFHKRKEGQTDFAVIFQSMKMTFFRGAAATVNWKNLDINFFYSYRKLDGGVDSTIVTSFKTDGLHRLVTRQGEDA